MKYNRTFPFPEGSFPFRVATPTKKVVVQAAAAAISSVTRISLYRIYTIAGRVRSWIRTYFFILFPVYTRSDFSAKGIRVVIRFLDEHARARYTVTTIIKVFFFFFWDTFIRPIISERERNKSFSPLRNIKKKKIPTPPSDCYSITFVLF